MKQKEEQKKIRKKKLIKNMEKIHKKVYDKNKPLLITELIILDLPAILPHLK